MERQPIPKITANISADLSKEVLSKFEPQPRIMAFNMLTPMGIEKKFIKK